MPVTGSWGEAPTLPHQKDAVIDTEAVTTQLVNISNCTTTAMDGDVNMCWLSNIVLSVISNT